VNSLGLRESIASDFDRDSSSLPGPSAAAGLPPDTRIQAFIISQAVLLFLFIPKFCSVSQERSIATKAHWSINQRFVSNMKTTAEHPRHAPCHSHSRRHCLGSRD
jgi:hypothetical protein